MLIGAHVSPAGGVAKAVERGVDRGCHAIQIFNQNPRAWKPREYPAEEVEAFHAAMDGSDVDALLIHAVYLLNCASDDAEIRAKTLDLADRLAAGGRRARRGRRRPAPGLGEDRRGRRRRSSAPARSSARRSPSPSACPLHLENTAGHGRDARALVRRAGGAHRRRRRRRAPRPVPGLLPPARVGLRDPHAPRASTRRSTSATREVGLDRLGSLHLNDSQTPLGSNRDRHANVGEGEIGEDGCAVFLSDPRFEDLPVRPRDAGPGQGGPDGRGDRADARAARARPRRPRPDDMTGRSRMLSRRIAMVVLSAAAMTLTTGAGTALAGVVTKVGDTITFIRGRGEVNDLTVSHPPAPSCSTSRAARSPPDRAAPRPGTTRPATPPA